MSSGGAPTQRQLLLLTLHAQGLTFEEIAKQAYISAWTVKHDLDDLRGMLGARNLSHALVLCVGQGLLCVDGREGRVFVPEPLAVAA